MECPGHSQKDWSTRGRRTFLAWRGCCGVSWWVHCITVLSCWRTCLFWPSIWSYFSQLCLMTPSLSPLSLDFPLSTRLQDSEGRVSTMLVFCSCIYLAGTQGVLVLVQIVEGSRPSEWSKSSCVWTYQETTFYPFSLFWLINIFSIFPAILQSKIIFIL